MTPFAPPVSVAAAAVGERFDLVALRQPGKMAIEQDGVGITFGQLKLAADAVAWRLLEAVGGAAGASRAAVFFNSRAAAIGAMLGAAKAGWAYIPLDAADPDDRLRFILSDCQPAALITDARHAPQARRLAPPGCDLIDIDALRITPRRQPLPRVDPDSLIYIFYTSGSTGLPKGVCQTHRHLQFFADAYGRTLGLCGDDRLSLLFSHNFSASNMHLYGGLLTGATLCSFDIRSRGRASLVQWLEEERVTVLHTVPSVMRQLAAGCGEHQRFASLRAVDLGGEALYTGDVEAFRRCLPVGCMLINHLGATEASVIAQRVVRDEPARGFDGHQSASPAQPGDGAAGSVAMMLPAGAAGAAADARAPVPVGCCPPGVRVTIHRDDGSEAAAGEVGDIVVHSPCLSRGYWNRPDLTAAAFAADPAAPGWRTYRSGDRGRMTAAGELVFLGRSGSRVKLRGLSVDLAEVEAALRRCPGVVDAAVVAPAADGREAEALRAFVVASSPDSRDPRKLRRALARLVPAYMLPSSFVFLDALPQTATGKTDRRALEQAGQPSSETFDAYEPPANDIERRVAELFEGLLDYAPAGRRDDFFQMGGDSLTLAELSHQLVEQFGGSVPDVIEEPTVAALAQVIQRNAADPSRAGRLMPVLLPLRKEGVHPILFLVHGRRGQAHVGRRFLELLGDDQPVWAFQARGVDGIQRPHETIDAMAADYVHAMRAVQPRGPYFLAALCSGSLVALKMANLLCRRGEQVGPLLLIDPPIPPYTIEQAKQNVAELAPGLRRLERDGQIEIDFTDANRRRGAVEVVVQFERAIVQHRPTPYEGAVYLLATGSRLTEEGWGSEAKRKVFFAGEFRGFPVGHRHTEILDPHNELFADTLRQCVDDARKAIASLASA